MKICKRAGCDGRGSFPFLGPAVGHDRGDLPCVVAGAGFPQPGRGATSCLRRADDRTGCPWPLPAARLCFPAAPGEGSELRARLRPRSRRAAPAPQPWPQGCSRVPLPLLRTELPRPLCQVTGAGGTGRPGTATVEDPCPRWCRRGLHPVRLYRRPALGV